MTHQYNSNLLNPITRITIQNFQSHSETILIPAGPGQLTVIVGQSRQGKTAIFRALRWLFYNAPDGADFIRWGCTFARVTAEYADGTQVIRYRTSGGVNRYIIRKPSLTTCQKGQMQEQVYEGFGRGAVPLEVQQITGVSPVEIGEGLTLNLNLAEQLDGPFLGNKSVSSTARAKVLGKLAGTEEVDLAGKQLGTDLFRWKREQEAHEKAIKDTEGQLQGYEYLPAFKANLDRLAAIRDTVKADMEGRDKLSTLYQECTIVSSRANDERLKLLRCQDLIARMIPAVEAIEAQIQTASRMSQTKSEWDKNQASLQDAQATINSTRGLSQAEDILGGAEGRFGRRQQAETIIARWNKIVWDLEQAEKIIGNTQGIFTAGALVDSAQRDITQLASLIQINHQHEVMLTRIWKAEWVLNETEGVPLAESSLAELYSSMDRKNKLAVLYGKWNRAKEDMAVVDRQMERTKGIGKAEYLFGTMESKFTNAKKVNTLMRDLDLNKYAINNEVSSMESAKENVEYLQDEYFHALKQAGNCPMCGGEISESNKKKIGEVI